MAEQWYRSIPPITRAYATACVVTTLAAHLDIIGPLALYLNVYSVYYQWELWRLVTCFLWFGPFSLSFVFHMYFLIRHSSALEEGSFRGRAGDYLYMLLFGGFLLVLASVVCFYYPALPFIMFLGPALSFMTVYVWSRRNPHSVLNLFGILRFRAPYLPWVLMGLGYILGQDLAHDVLGIAVGHVYFFLEDVYPLKRPGRRLLRTPGFMYVFAPLFYR
eukprot:CAMPEP_0114632428 /NCGR_PEP_ID=MMETSP0168-20121206/14930_1 /TAXON_ID=95228 ORGANISM="Vannella sp., Strain DIVA3 517/6/12" /NCGR_SAMPLE_ID=MMETSP0168 /ASSEMBLY_ACC=CAM_ASM_000044 /LENGTH=217 /DNA_ID=CAMNT_0001844039 /DNA_START=28 /DNA_END=681 /DNA_ORIENTATION=+